MYEVLYTGSLQLVHACGSTGNDEEGTVVEILEGGDGIGGILVVARTENHYVGSSLQGCVNTLLHCVETEVVDNLVSCTSEEVRAKLSASLTPCQVTDGEHECCGHLAAFLGGDAQILEVGSQTGRRNLLVCRLLL